MLESVDPAAVPSLRGVLVGGEAVAPTLLARWSGVDVRVLYGATEATIAQTMAVRAFDGRVVLGEPMVGISVLVLDRRFAAGAGGDDR